VPQPLKCWNDRHVSSYPDLTRFFLGLSFPFE
jgi:hypothetical protein